MSIRRGVRSLSCRHASDRRVPKLSAAAATVLLRLRGGDAAGPGDTCVLGPAGIADVPLPTVRKRLHLGDRCRRRPALNCSVARNAIVARFQPLTATTPINTKFFCGV